MGFAPKVRKHYMDSMKVLTRPASVFVGAATTTIFSVLYGHILLIALTGRVIVEIAAGANTLRTYAPGAVAMDDNTVSIDAMAVGTNLFVPGLVGGPITVVRAQLIAPSLPWDCVVGNFACLASANTTPGTIQWSLAYLPCTEDTVVVIA